MFLNVFSILFYTRNHAHEIYFVNARTISEKSLRL